MTTQRLCIMFTNEKRFLNCASCKYLSKYPVFGTMYKCYPQGELFDKKDLEETLCEIHEFSLLEEYVIQVK